MAMYILVAIPGDKDAQQFVKEVNSGKVFYRNEDGTYAQIPEGTFVRGLWKKPTLFHEDLPAHVDKQTGYVRSPNYGWYVCSGCGRPSKLWAEGDHWYTALGTNMLPVSPTAPEWRGKGVRGHVYNAERKEWISVHTGKPWDGKRLPGEGK
jgi:hypothetical protein